VTIDNVKVTFKIDTGANVNVFSLCYIDKSKQKEIKQSKIKLYAFGGTSIEALGKIYLKCKIINKNEQTYCDLCEENSNNEFPCVDVTTESVLRHLKNIHNISNQQESNKTQRCVLYNMSELTHIIVIIITASNITYNIIIILIFNNFFSSLIPTLVLVCYSYIINIFSINLV